MNTPERLPRTPPGPSAEACSFTLGRRRIEVKTSPWFPVSVALVWLVLWASLARLDSATRAGSAPVHILASSVAATVLVYATSVVHEAGHVVAAELVGHRWVLLDLRGSGLAVGILPDDPRGWQRIIRSAAGPVAQIVVGAALAAPFFAEPLFFGSPRSLVPLHYVVWWFPGLLAIGIGLINLLPFPGLDGWKIWQGIVSLRVV